MSPGGAVDGMFLERWTRKHVAERTSAGEVGCMAHGRHEAQLQAHLRTPGVLHSYPVVSRLVGCASQAGASP